MKKLFPCTFALLFLITTSCTEKKEEVVAKVPTTPMRVLPFETIPLSDLTHFKEVSENWKIVENTAVDRSKEQTIHATEGNGVLVNIPEKGKNDNLFTNFEHGDIEFECDVMMPVNSNSGIYFQGRYEVQLFDSWGKENPQHSDMGGIYQRWDSMKSSGEEGFEGASPRINAAKAPGLWQHIKVIFHAPKFDASGQKTENARFEEVWLNGALIHKNVEVSGPTRAAAFNDEKNEGPLMIQGDHGPVAIQNIKYKLYEDRKVQMAAVRMKEYENTLPLFPNLDSLAPIREVQTDSIAATMATGERPRKLLSYVGKLKIPESGDYIFDYKLNRAGGAFLIGADTIISMNGNYNLDSLGIAKVTLEKGEVPFQLIYNKHIPWQMGFGFYVEGPGIQKHALHAPSSLISPDEEVNPDYLIALEDEPITQRCFWMHNGKKRTHCISVGNPNGIHYTYDLESGSLLQVWNGDFMDATKMWQGRGEKQLGQPAGFIVSFHGDPEFEILENEDSAWKHNLEEIQDYRQLGYEFDADGIPAFSHLIGKTAVTSKHMPSSSKRELQRLIATSGNQEFWHKIAEGTAIEKLSDGTFVVNDESYFVDFSNNKSLEPQIRSNNGKDELLVKIPAGEQQLNYSIIW